VYTSENNWYHWSYGSLPSFSRQTDSLPFKTTFSKYKGSVSTFKDELCKAAASTIDHANDKITVLFSGGVDSEIMLRAFLDIGYTPKIVIARYENDYNIYDVSYAVTICSMLNVEYKIIDFNLTHFFENDADRVSELAEIDRPRALPYCKILELIDEIPVFGRGEPNPIKIDNQWIQRCHEYDVGRIKYAQAINKPAFAEWFKWTPGLVISYMNLIWFNDLIKNKYNAVDSVSTKMIGYREAYPELIDRVKKTGFEKIDTLINEVDTHLFNKYGRYPYRATHDRDINQWYTEITSKRTMV